MNRGNVEEVLLEMGTPIRTKGFKYIEDAVLLLDDPDWCAAKWTAIYNKIARMNSTTATKVERNIRTALETTRDNVANFDAVEKYIGFHNCQNSNSLIRLHQTIRKDIVDSNITDSDKIVIGTDYLKQLIYSAVDQILKEQILKGAV